MFSVINTLVARLINLDPCTLSSEGVLKITQKLKFLETISNLKGDSLVTLAQLLKTVMHLFKVLASDNAVWFSDIPLFPSSLVRTNQPLGTAPGFLGHACHFHLRRIN